MKRRWCKRSVCPLLLLLMVVGFYTAAPICTQVEERSFHFTVRRRDVSAFPPWKDHHHHHGESEKGASNPISQSVRSPVPFCQVETSSVDSLSLSFQLSPSPISPTSPRRRSFEATKVKDVKVCVCLSSISALMASSSSFFNLSVILLGLAGTLSVVQGIRCFQCGTYIITSVTPCRNLTIATLNECPAESTHCSKYSGPAMEVYGCEKNCEEKVQNSFEIHCCNEDRCNGVEGVVRKSSSALLVLGVLLSATLSLTASFTSSTSSLRL